ncbi:kynurenine 3-monooxygenase [Trichonephila clavipes]|nr:kynurenine 3-monooxygenase [Trichonephila clavipes]
MVYLVPYSPDLTPSDFWLSPIMKDTLHGCSFPNRAVTVSAIFPWAKHTGISKEEFSATTGFEDCEILSELLTTYKYDLREVLPAFSKIRNKDAEVACDLSKSIYTIMKEHTTKKYIIRNKLDIFLNAIFPKSWILLNSEINFSKMRYSQCLARKLAQDKILSNLLWSLMVIGFVSITIMMIF